MFSFGTITGRARTFGHDRRGNFGLAFAGVSAALLLAIGYGVNISQIYSAKSALLAALDTAVTSTARDITTGKISKEEAPDLIRAFLMTNAQNSQLRGRDVQLTSLDINDTDKTVSATATVDLAMFFPLFHAENSQHIKTNSTALYSDRKIEVVMMLDNTGSMSGNNKLKDLKTAAKNAVDSFFAMQDLKKTRVRVGIVPYANSVNVGSLAEDVVFAETSSTGHMASSPKPTDKIVTDIKQANGGKLPRPDNCATERKGTLAWSDAGPADAMVSRDIYLTSFASSDGTPACPAAAMMPLTTDADALKTRIETFKAQGTTAGHIGVQWTWYMLSPQWKSVLPASAQPAAYDTKKTGKFAILMTDGEFNLEYAGASSGNKATTGGTARSMASSKSLCGEMKKAGIEVFTIGFRLTNSEAKTTMSNCASPDTSYKHYFEAADGGQLDAAFKTIAANIERLALTN